jgi:hypothetical protein
MTEPTWKAKPAFTDKLRSAARARLATAADALEAAAGDLVAFQPAWDGWMATLGG